MTDRISHAPRQVRLHQHEWNLHPSLHDQKPGCSAELSPIRIDVHRCKFAQHSAAEKAALRKQFALVSDRLEKQYHRRAKGVFAIETMCGDIVLARNGFLDANIHFPLDVLS